MRLRYLIFVKSLIGHHSFQIECHVHLNSLCLIIHFLDHLVFSDPPNIALNSTLIVRGLAVGARSARFLGLNDPAQDSNPRIQIHLSDCFDRLNFLFGNRKSKELQRLCVDLNLFEAIISDSGHPLKLVALFGFFFNCIDRGKVYQVIVLVSYQRWSPMVISHRNYFGVSKFSLFKREELILFAFLFFKWKTWN